MRVDGEGMPLSAGTTPANGDQPAQINTLLEQVKGANRETGSSCQTCEAYRR